MTQQATQQRQQVSDPRVLPQDVQKVSKAQIIGPFAQDAEVSELIVDGYRVPYVTLLRENGSAQWTLIMDNRLRVQGTEEEIDRWGPFLAQYGARCANMTSHGPDSTYLNPFGPSGIVSPEQQNAAQAQRRF